MCYKRLKKGGLNEEKEMERGNKGYVQLDDGVKIDKPVTLMKRRKRSIN